jgi:hypothetical protein
VLTEEYGINGSDLVTVGYGKTKPKDPSAPMDPGQPPRPGRQHGYQDRREVIRAIDPPAGNGRRIFCVC